MKEQILKVPWDAEFKCIYCSHPLAKSDPEHDRFHSYKTVTCTNPNCESCRRKVWVKVKFDGSGHDNVEHSELEQKVEFLNKIF